MLRRALAVVALSLVAAASGAAATPRPPLPDLSKYGKPLTTHTVKGPHGLVFKCFTFWASDGFLVECFLVRRPAPPPPSTPA